MLNVGARKESRYHSLHVLCFLENKREVQNGIGTGSGFCWFLSGPGLLWLKLWLGPSLMALGSEPSGSGPTPPAPDKLIQTAWNWGVGAEIPSSSPKGRSRYLICRAQ